MKTHDRTRFLMIGIVLICTLIIIVTTWGVSLHDSPAFVDTELSDSSDMQTTDGTDPFESDSETTDSSSSETTTGKINGPETPTKMIALTFDDGPSSKYTHEILDLLEEYDAKATFFVLGSMLSSATRDELQRAIALGCEIGSHSYSHSYLTSLSAEALAEEMRSTNEKISLISGVDYECKLYRPPYGSIDRDVMETLYVNDLKMHAILWSSDSRDWEYKQMYYDGEITRAEAVQGAFETICSETSDGTVILMHDIHEITPDILKLVLEKYSAEGYTFVTVSELFGFENDMDEESYYYRYRSADSIVYVKD